MNTCVIISYYDRRPLQHLRKLINELSTIEAGSGFDVCIVVNQTSNDKLKLESSLPLTILHRNNLGMNIGAWDFGWRQNQGYQRYVFLQDDCYIAKPGWLTAIIDALSQASVGLVGESINDGWDLSWDRLRAREINVRLPEHDLNGQPVNRVDCYLDFLSRHSITPVKTALHMRSIVWALKADTMDAIGGFPIGSNYGECIAAEIGISQQLLGMGLQLALVANKPFRYIRHLEWNQDFPGARFSHKPVYLNKLQKLTAENKALKQRLAQVQT